MESGDRRNRLHETDAKTDLEFDVDGTATGPIDFEPPVKDWIEYLAGRLAREIIRESSGHTQA
jgi:hypothetical protein